MRRITKILVPTDLSELSLASIDYARSLANVYGARVFLLHAVDVVPVVSFPTIDFTLETSLQDEAEKGKEILENFASRFLGDVEQVTAVVRRGFAYEEIMRFVDEEGIDLIVMATHGRTGLPHIIMGSVAERVVRHSPVPVLTIKPPKVQEQSREREHPAALHMQ
jgi:nucleotide-binding universal stress UspA family protein